MDLSLAQYLSLLTRYLGPQRGRVVLLTILALASVALQVVNPQLIRAFIDGALSGRDGADLGAIAALFIAAVLVSQAVAIAATYVAETVGWTATNALRTDLAAHLLGLDMSFHKAHTPGEMIQRIDGDVEALSTFFSRFTLYVAANLVLMMGVLALLLREDWRLGLTISIFATTALVALVWLRILVMPRWLALREAQAQFYGFLSEHLTSREDVRGNGARTYAMQRFHNHLQRWQPVAVRSGMGFAWMWMSSLALFTLGNVVALAFAYSLWAEGAVTIGSVYLIFHYTEMLRRPIEQIREQIQQLQNAGASVVRVQQLLQVRSRIVDRGTRTLQNGPLQLNARDVSFGYEPDELVLEQVSLSLEPGEILGLVGRTGGGKTTLGRLIVRLYEPSEGVIRLNGIDLAELPVDELRRRVGVVSQDVQILDGSVRDNLTFFDPTPDDRQSLAAIESLGLGAWFGSLPAGLDSRVSRADLSAGEAQMLACARVFLTDPGLVILDEATSRLDPATQRLVDIAMTRLLEGRTAILIAHRLSTLERVRTVAVMEQGRIVELGPYSALLANPASRFSHLHRLDAEGLLV